MTTRNNRAQSTPRITIRVSGKLFDGHLEYLDQLVQSAAECHLWPVLSLAQLEDLDRAALTYLIDGENRDFDLVACPKFIREQIELERDKAAA